MEGILELIQKRQAQHSSNPEIPVVSSTNADSNNRLDRLEKLVEELTNKLTAVMQPASLSQRVARRAFVITVENPLTKGTHSSNLKHA